jgi:gas vesicle protein
MNNAVRTNDTEKRSSSLGLLTGLLIGTLAGLGAMMLFAPQSGKRTRSQIGQESTKLQDRAAHTFKDLVAWSHFDNRKIMTRAQG